MIDGAVRMGMPYDVASVAAAKVMEGTARMVLETGEHPAALKSKVCTPGGTTIGGLLTMEDRGLRSAIARGVEEAANISASFAKSKNKKCISYLISLFLNKMHHLQLRSHFE